MAETKFKIYSLLVVKNEADIIAAQLEDACRWSDKIIVLDNGSEDATWDIVQQMARQHEQIIAFGQEKGTFSIGLRAQLFRAFRKELHRGDWWCVRLDADEFYPGDVRAFLQSVPQHYSVVSKASTDFMLSKDDLPHLTGQWEKDRNIFSHALFTHRRERRFMRHTPYLMWLNSWRYPHPWGKEYPHGIPVHHYQYRSVEQMKKRFQTRQKAKADGCGTFLHECGKGWEDYLWENRPMTLQEQFNQATRVLQKGRNEIRTDGQIVIKSFAKPQGWRKIIYSFFRNSKAQRSYEIALRLGDKTPQPIGYQELRHHRWLSESYYACALSPCPHQFKELRNPACPDRERHLKAIARFTAALHEQGIYHTDYSQGNILWDDDDHIQIVDLNRVHFYRSISLRKGIRNFQRLHLGDDDMYNTLIQEYLQTRKYK